VATPASKWSIGSEWDCGAITRTLGSTKEEAPRSNVERRLLAADSARLLSFVGLPWIHDAKSGLLFGVEEDAAFIAAHIEARNTASEGRF
jgi:putative flavoprotein involved in K+ transport